MDKEISSDENISCINNSNNPQEEGKEMPALLEKEQKKSNLNIDHEKFKKKVPRLSVVNGIAQIDSNNPLHKKWFEKFKK